MARFRAAALGGRSPEMALLIIGVAALGFNLRGPITSLPPVYRQDSAKCSHPAYTGATRLRPGWR
jgi:cyanate permease